MNSSANLQSVPIERLTCHPDLQMRVRIDDDHVNRLYQAYAGGEAVPPISVIHDVAHDRLLVTDGHHRVAAARLAGMREITCLVTPGSFLDAACAAARANRTHGLPRSDLDVWFTLERWLAHPELSRHSFAQIAQAVHAEPALVRRVAGMLAIAGVRPPHAALADDPRASRPLVRQGPSLPDMLSGWRARDAAGWDAPGYILEHERTGLRTRPARNLVIAWAHAQRLAAVPSAEDEESAPKLNAPALIIGVQSSPYEPPPLLAATIRGINGDSAVVDVADVRLRLPMRRVRQALDAPPPALAAATLRYAQALRELADHIRRATRYDRAMAQMSSNPTVNNPLDDLAIVALDPDEALQYQPADWYEVPTAPTLVQALAHTRVMVQARPWPSSGRSRAVMHAQADVYLATPELRDLIIDAARTVASAAAAWRAALDQDVPVWTMPPGRSSHPSAPPAPPPPAAVTATVPAVTAPDPTITIPSLLSEQGGASRDFNDRQASLIDAPVHDSRSDARHSWERAALQRTASMAIAAKPPPEEVSALQQRLLAQPRLALRLLALTLALWDPDLERARHDIRVISAMSDDDIAQLGARAVLEALHDALPDIQGDVQAAFHALVGPLV